jgi:hypothetical protein
MLLLHSHHTSVAACIPTARVVVRPLLLAQRHPLHMPPTPTSTMQPSAAPWPQRERGHRQRGHPLSMSPSLPPVRPLLTTDTQTAHAVVVQSPHVCGCLHADGLHCRALLCVLSSRRNATLLTITCRPPLPAQCNHLLFPGPGEKGDVDSGVTHRLCPLPRHLFSLSRTPTLPSPASVTLPSPAPPCCLILTARQPHVLPLALARKGMQTVGSPAVYVPFLAACLPSLCRHDRALSSTVAAHSPAGTMLPSSTSTTLLSPAPEHQLEMALQCRHLLLLPRHPLLLPHNTLFFTTFTPPHL